MAGLASVLEVLITGDSTSLKTALAQGSVATKQFAATTQTATQQTAKGVSKLSTVAKVGYASAAVGAAYFAKQSIDSAIAFNRSFTQIAALTNVADSDLQRYKDTVMSLASETAVAPVELAHAMYFLASAGLSTQQQMDAITATAHGVAVGLGEAGDLARITANALNVFGDSGLTATAVMDTLVAAIREGTAEPDEFADALGRVLPIADKAGISFQQVAASLATMSNAGLDVHEGVTALRAILQSLVSPTAQTVSALARVGLTADDVVASMKGEGLIATLRMVDKAARQNSTSTGDYNRLMRKLIPNIRGLAGAFNLTTQDAEKVNNIFKAVVNSSGDMSKAFAVTAGSDAFKLKKALNDLSIIGQNLATDILPALATGLKFVADNASFLLTLLGSFLIVKTISALMTSLSVQSGIAAVATEGLGSASALAAGGIVAEGEAAVVTSTYLMGRLVPAEVVATEAAVTMGETTTAALAAGTLALVPYIALVYGAIKAWQGVSKEIEIVKSDMSGWAKIQGMLDTAFKNEAFQAVNPWTRGIDIAALTTEDAAATISDALDTVRVGLTLTSNTADENAKIVNDAMASIGGTLTADNAQAFVDAVQKGNTELMSQKVALEQQAEAAKKYAAEQQAAKEATKGWQDSMGTLTGKLQSLSILGIDVNSFLEDFKKKLTDALDKQGAFAEGLATINEATQKWRDETAASITGVSDVLSTLADDSNTTASDVINAFEKAAAAARSFSADLVTISKTGGDSGAQLANALLQMGPSAAGLANTIANSGTNMRKEMVKSFGDILSAGQNGATALQDALVPVLDDIRSILTKIAKFWGVDLTMNDHGAQKKVQTVQVGLQTLTKKQYNVFLQAHTDEAALQVQKVHVGLLNLTRHQYDVFVNVHTRPKSPWPDEALKTHLFDPLQQHGAKKIGGVWTIPLEVGVHTKTGRLGNVNAALAGYMGASEDELKRAQRVVGKDNLAKLLHSMTVQAHKTGVLHLARLTAILRHTKMTAEEIRNWRREAGKAFNQGLQEQRDPKWLQNALTDVPKLPPGGTDISVNHHPKRKVTVKMDRRHFDEQMAYEEAYRGF